MQNSNLEMNQAKKSNTATIALSVFLGLAVLMGGYFGFKNYKLSNSNEALTSEMQSTRTNLLIQIDDLQSSYDDLLVDNSGLEEDYAEMIFQLEEKDQEIERLRTTSGMSVKDEVQRLRALKDEYASVLYELHKQADILGDANNSLMNQNADLRDQMAKMKNKNEQLASKVFELRQAPKNLPMAMTVKGNTEVTYTSKGSGPDAQGQFQVSTTGDKQLAKATNFEIIPKKKKEKVTGSHKRTRKIDVYFDVKNTSMTMNGDEELYLVIKDINGMSVEVENPIKTMINNSNEQIIAQQSMVVNLQKDRRLKFEIAPKRKTLHEGYYRASVYSVDGLLGTEEFYLR